MRDGALSSLTESFRLNSGDLTISVRSVAICKIQKNKTNSDGVVDWLVFHSSIIYLWAKRHLLFSPLSTAHQRGAEDSL